MTTADIKSKIITKLKQTSDADLLEDFYRLLLIDESELEILHLTNEQDRQIDTARKQYQDGQFLSQEQANKEIDEWLNQ